MERLGHGPRWPSRKLTEYSDSGRSVKCEFVLRAINRKLWNILPTVKKQMLSVISVLWKRIHRSKDYVGNRMQKAAFNTSKMRYSFLELRYQRNQLRMYVCASMNETREQPWRAFEWNTSSEYLLKSPVIGDPHTKVINNQATLGRDQLELTTYNQDYYLHTRKAHSKKFK